MYAYDRDLAVDLMKARHKMALLCALVQGPHPRPYHFPHPRSFGLKMGIDGSKILDILFTI